MKFHVIIPYYFEISASLFWQPLSNKLSNLNLQNQIYTRGILLEEIWCFDIKGTSSMPLTHTKYMCVCVNKPVFKVILGNACVGSENLIPIVSPDISWLILKTVFKNKSGYFNNIFSWNVLRASFSKVYQSAFSRVL